MTDSGTVMTTSFADAVTTWYATSARDLPWRRAGVSPWGVLVSEIMLQQTPAARVEPVWTEWMSRWPHPVALAAEPSGAAVRAWGRLGYPRRALRLHECAVALADRHDGAVPDSYDALLALPGIGPYTAAAVATFAFGQPHPVLDTNVRRVYARVFDGAADAPSGAPGRAERAAALSRVTTDHPERYSVAVMELGAIVCTARRPECGRCPVADGCAWRAAGRPANRPARPAQRYAGTDRQARGRLLAVVRESEAAVSHEALEAVWSDAAQRDRALAGLLADGLVEPAGAARYRLPG
jgi:A/G-specific adenine glycosylase